MTLDHDQKQNHPPKIISVVLQNIYGEKTNETTNEDEVSKEIEVKDQAAIM